MAQGFTKTSLDGAIGSPGSSTDNALARWDGIGGASLQNSSVIVSDNGEMTNASQPAFLVYLSASQVNVTGDGTAYTIPWDTEVFDQNADFDTATGTFTAPVTGRYQMNVTIRYEDIDAAHTAGTVNIRVSNRTGINQVRLDPSSYAETGANNAQWGASFLFDMDAADTSTVRTQISNGTKIIDVIGTGASGSYFSGYLVC